MSFRPWLARMLTPMTPRPPGISHWQCGVDEVSARFPAFASNCRTSSPVSREHGSIDVRDVLAVLLGGGETGVLAAGGPSEVPGTLPVGTAWPADVLVQALAVMASVAATGRSEIRVTRRIVCVDFLVSF